MAPRSGMVGMLRAARAVEAALARVGTARALRLPEVAQRTGISLSRLRRLLPAMIAAGWPVEARSDPVTSGAQCNRPRVYSLAVLDEMRQASGDGSQDAR